MSRAKASAKKTGPGGAAGFPVGDEAVRRATGKGWDEWLAVLDAEGANGKAHAEIARFLERERGVPGWRAQSITVGYERARGMRREHERPDGFSVSVSKTYPVDVGALFEAVTDARRRARWLEPGTLSVRTTVEGKSARFDFEAGEGRVQAYFVAKRPGEATLQLSHERLSDEAAVEAMRAFWKARLARLGERLEG